MECAFVLPPFAFSECLKHLSSPEPSSISHLPFRFNKLNSQNLYEILGVSWNATAAEIKAAYRQEALKWHPDKHMDVMLDKRVKMELRFKAVNHAGSILRDAEKRLAYDVQATASPDQFSTIPEDMTQSEAMQLFVEFFVACLKAQQTRYPSATLFFTSLSLPMLFGAYGGVDAVMLGFAISSLLNGEGVRDVMSALTDDQRTAIYHAARILLERDQ